MTSSSPLKLFIIGGHGKVALHLTKSAISQGHQIFSQIRSAEQTSDLPRGQRPNQVEPVVVSLEDASVSKLSSLFDQYDPNVIFFIAGAGGKGGPERTKAVDEQGAIKVFDAIEESSLPQKQSFRRFLLCSAVDSRDIKNTKPDWYQDKDFETSQRMRKVLGPYMEAKYNADLNLSKRTSFPWFVLRPSALKDVDGTGKVNLAVRKGISEGIPRQDVANIILSVAQLPKGHPGVDWQMWDLIGGEGGVDIDLAVKEAADRGRSDWIG
ncbi:unnamed protein product [Sympodiomycopsis kandeliae]